MHIFPDDIEGLLVELNFRKSKLLLLGTYHPPNQDDYYFQTVGNALEMYITKYEKNILAGNFNAEVSEVNLSNFLDIYGLKSLVHEKTCYKSIENPSCIDLLLTNCSKSFQKISEVQ